MLEFNQAGFLKQMMIKKSAGVYIFSNPGSHTLMTLAETGSGWIFDSLAGITAQVVAITYEPVFNIMDSVKHITLSNGKDIRLSKDHGLLSFPTSDSTEYHLLGIAGPDLGTLLPGFSDIFSFNVGDVFQYFYESDSDNSGLQHSSQKEKRTILQKEIIPDGYSYLVQSMRKHWSYFTVSTSVDSMNITFLRTDYPLAEIEPKDTVQDYFSIQIAQAASAESKTLGPQSYDPVSGDTFSYHPGFASTLTLSRHLGITYRYETWMNYDQNPYFHHELVGYIINGDTTGEILPNWYFTGITESESQVTIRLYPVPSSGELNIILPDKVKHEVDYFINSSDGKLRRKGIIDKNVSKIDITSLPDGYYIFRITSDMFSGSSRFLKISK